MQNNWFKELSQFLWIGLVVAVFGLGLGQLTLLLFLYTLIYLGWYFYNLKRIETWLYQGKKSEPPQARGLWGEMFNGIYRLQQRSRKRNKRLVKFLNRFRETTGALPYGVIVLREQGDIEWWNNAAQNLLNLKYPQDVGQRMGNLIRHPRFNAYIRGEIEQRDVVIPSPLDDQIMLNVRIIPYGKKQSLVTIRDVTLIQQVEQMRRDFVANISHELRTPLTVLSGYVENLLEKTPDEASLKHALNLMSQQTRRMQHLTEDLMLLSSLENNAITTKREIVNVAQMLTSLREEAIVLSGDKQHTIELEADKNLHLRGNPKELDSVFTNLVVNAVNYTPANGHITIRWYMDDVGGAHFEVEDTGTGIASHHLARLTERFYRVDAARSRATGGSGLGLAIVKHAMQQNQGKLRIESELGRGSRFICDFPAQSVVYKNLDNAKSTGTA
jgi:two-component system phosphate regulon sensor histidine kinase PhoR